MTYKRALLVTFFMIILPSLSLAEQKNIILMLSDDQSWAGLSIKMDPNDKNSISLYDQTPNLKRLASQGTRFTAAYAPSPVCSPSRISIQTGKTPAKLKWTKAAPFFEGNANQYLIPPKHEKNIDELEFTIGEVLKHANYNTAHLGKWHLLGGGPQKHGYDLSDGDTGNKYASKFSDPNPVDLFGMVERAEQFINKSNKENKPFFVQLSFNALHYPENAIKKTIQKYNNLYSNKLNSSEIQRLALNENMDKAIGRLLDFLEKKKLSKNTYIVFMADNGAFRKFSSLRGGKGTLWEGGIRVPFIIKGPGIPENSVNRSPIVGYDLFPTFMSIAGLDDFPLELDGINIFETFKANHQLETRPNGGLFFHFPHYQKKQTPASAIIFNNWKLIKHYDEKTDLLFDLSKDISEKHNLISKYPEVYERLLTQLESYLLSVNASMPVLNPGYEPQIINSKELSH